MLLKDIIVFTHLINRLSYVLILNFCIQIYFWICRIRKRSLHFMTPCSIKIKFANLLIFYFRKWAYKILIILNYSYISKLIKTWYTSHLRSLLYVRCCDDPLLGKQVNDTHSGGYNISYCIRVIFYYADSTPMEIIILYVQLYNTVVYWFFIFYFIINLIKPVDFCNI